MTPVLLLLLSAALNSATSSENSAGDNFIVIFPENIAFYYPGAPQNKLYITALSDNTNVKITSAVHTSQTIPLSKGQTETSSYDGNMELNKSKFSKRSFQIKSSNKVTIQAVSLKNTSMQTALITPDDKLGTNYFIPPLPTSQGNAFNVTERQPFKLIIVNTDQPNKVIVEAQHPQNFSLEPNQVVHVFIADNTYRAVMAEKKVAVIFGHTCAIRKDCTCSLLYAMLPPARENRPKFYIPKMDSTDTEAESYVLLADGRLAKKEKVYSHLPFVETSGTAILFRPGLLLNLIPDTDFASCYLIYALPDVENFAVIVVHKDVTGGVHIGKSPLANPKWEHLSWTDYVSTKVPLKHSGQNVVWHSSSTMAVYFQGNKEETLFGNPAMVINKSPDFRGCVLSPEEIKIGDAKGWQESVEYCYEIGMELISFSTPDHQRHIYTKINQDKDPSLQEVWIGMRRSSMTGEWYWLNGDTVSETNWAEEEPGTVQEGQCAIMSVDSSKNFGWSDEDCCVKARPLCYKPPVLFPINQG